MRIRMAVKSRRSLVAKLVVTITLILFIKVTYFKRSALPVTNVSLAGQGRVAYPREKSHDPIPTRGSSSPFFLSTPRRQGVDVVLNAKYRSGSSFTGEFFNQHGDFVYFFEPLHNTNQNALVTDIDAITSILGDLLSCSAKENNITGAGPAWAWKWVVLCGLGAKCNNVWPPPARKWGDQYQTMCKSRPHHAAKVIRVASIASLVPLMRRGVKVIHLIRDPRGTYMSRSRLAIGNRSRVDDIKRYCDILKDDLDTIRGLYKDYKDDLCQVLYIARYEDLASRPLWYLNEIYTFLGVEPDENVVNWAFDLHKKNIDGMKNGSIKAEFANIISTDRECPKQTAFAWRQRIHNRLLNTIQNVCSDFFQKFGYTVYRSSNHTLFSQEPMIEIADLITGD